MKEMMEEEKDKMKEEWSGLDINRTQLLQTLLVSLSIS